MRLVLKNTESNIIPDAWDIVINASAYGLSKSDKHISYLIETSGLLKLYHDLLDLDLSCIGIAFATLLALSNLLERSHEFGIKYKLITVFINLR